MPSKGTAWHSKMTDEERAEFCAIYNDHEGWKLRDIAEMYGKADSEISTAARRFGCPPRRMRKGTVVTPQSDGLREVERRLQDAAAREEALRKEIAELRRRRDELQIRFECDGTDVLVYGVADTPLRASSLQWVTWLNAEGARKLRNFITERGGPK